MQKPVFLSLPRAIGSLAVAIAVIYFVNGGFSPAHIHYYLLMQTFWLPFLVSYLGHYLYVYMPYRTAKLGELIKEKREAKEEAKAEAAAAIEREKQAKIDAEKAAENELKRQPIKKLLASLDDY